jgi:hypothetical protein
MAFIVIYDANVLYPNKLRDLLIRIAQAGLVQARWTNQILDEMLRALNRNRPDIQQGKLDRLRLLMNAAVRDCLIEGHEPLIEGLKVDLLAVGAEGFVCEQGRAWRGRPASRLALGSASVAGGGVGLLLGDVGAASP